MLHSHFGIYAIIAHSDNQKILLIKKARGPYEGRFDLPGGSIENSELLEECLAREIEEETGCEIVNFKQIETISSFFDYQNPNQEDCRLRHIGVLYKVDIAGAIKQDGDGEDSNGCIWSDINLLDSSNSTPFVLWAINYLKQ
ncbi:MAG: ADP-ribose pyrophosphatase YjhB (NUDIX family) [Rickettsiales bacterium]|jgi:ADP-ribose pyrophosphatase YjhB (NUDIX family)